MASPKLPQLAGRSSVGFALYTEIYTGALEDR